eukprot:m.187700 g.187700  ORF g.187700 m.187700 type:complete len:655 (+) comp17526_c4_seq2:977-2941(+)
MAETTLCWVRARFSYDSKEGEGLSLTEGALLRVVQKAESGWWKGVVANDPGREGWFPASYVEEVPAPVEESLYGDHATAAAAPAHVPTPVVAPKPTPAPAPAPANPPKRMLPQGWHECIDEHDRVYYTNEATGASQWEFPTAPSESSTDDYIPQTGTRQVQEVIYAETVSDEPARPQPVARVPVVPRVPSATAVGGVSASGNPQDMYAKVNKPTPGVLPKPGRPEFSAPPPPATSPTPLRSPVVPRPVGAPPAAPNAAPAASNRLSTHSAPLYEEVSEESKQHRMAAMAAAGGAGAPDQTTPSSAMPKMSGPSGSGTGTHAAYFIPFAMDPPKRDESKFHLWENFWQDRSDKTGFDILVLKHRNGKEVCKDMAEYFKQRAVVEDAYAKSLQKLAKNLLGDMEEGTMGMAWQRFKGEIMHTSTVHSCFALALSQDLEVSLMEFKESQKGARKSYEKLIADTRKDLINAVPSMEKAYHHYRHKATECKQLMDQEASGQQDGMSAKEFQKLKESAEKHYKKLNKIAEETKAVIASYNETQGKWVEAMTNACKDFEEAERDRHQFIKSIISRFCQHTREMHQASENYLRDVETMYNSSTTDADVAEFSRREGTSQCMPMPVPFLNPQQQMQQIALEQTQMQLIQQQQQLFASRAPGAY